jgi:hypothetical protein
MTKAEIQNLINTNLADGSGILAEKHREVEAGLLDNSYGTIINENRTTTNHGTRVTNPNVVKIDILYGISILKQGRIVIIKGFVWNQTGSIISNNYTNDFVFEIVDSEYFPDLLSTTTIFPTGLGTFVELNSTEKKFYCNELGNGELRTFNIQYFTNN